MKLQDIHSTAKQNQDKTGILPMFVPADETRRLYADRMDTDGDGQRSLLPSEVRAMQRQRGEEPCFSTDKRYSCSRQCDLRKDCLKLRAVWLR